MLIVICRRHISKTESLNINGCICSTKHYRGIILKLILSLSLLSKRFVFFLSVICISIRSSFQFSIFLITSGNNSITNLEILINSKLPWILMLLIKLGRKSWLPEKCRWTRRLCTAQS